MLGDGKFENFNLEDIHDFLYYKVMDNDYTDEEYGLFLDLRQYGKKAIQMNRNTTRKVLKEMRRECDGFKF